MYRGLKYWFEAVLMFLMIAVCNTPGAKKYIVIILTGLTLLFLGRRKKWSVESLFCILLPAIVYLLFGGVSSFFNFNIQVTTVKIMLFWLLPLFFSFSLYVYFEEKMLDVVDIQFFSCCLVYVLPNIRGIIEKGYAESVFAFVFGIYIIFYANRKRWFHLLIAMILMYYSEKRIAMLAAFATLAVMAILWLFRNHKKLALAIWCAVACGVLFYVWAICSGTLAYFCQGIGINTNGRIKMYTNIVEWFGNSAIIFGRGLGTVERLLECWKVFEFNNLHNDLLKFYIEIGCLGLTLYMLSYGIVINLVGKIFGNKQMKLFLGIAIYSIALFATDNVSIYIIYLIPMYTILFAILAEKKQEDMKQVYD